MIQHKSENNPAKDDLTGHLEQVDEWAQKIAWGAEGGINQKKSFSLFWKLKFHAKLNWSSILAPTNKRLSFRPESVLFLQSEAAERRNSK